MPDLCLEVVTRLGDSIVAIRYVELACRSEIPARHGRATIEVRAVERPRREPLRPPIEWHPIAALVVSSALHLAIVLKALQGAPDAPSGGSREGRPRLVTNRTSSPRATRAPTEVASVDQQDERRRVERKPPTRRGTGAPGVPPHAVSHRRRETGTAARDSVMPRHSDPCADGSCGLIPSGPYPTAAHGHEAGQDYDLRPHRELALSVVTCDLGSGCSTVSGDDQDDIRAEVARHFESLDACFDSAPPGATSLVEARAVGGTVRAEPHDGDALGRCLASALGQLALHARDGHVTITFTRG